MTSPYPDRLTGFTNTVEAILRNPDYLANLTKNQGVPGAPRRLTRADIESAVGLLSSRDQYVLASRLTRKPITRVQLARELEVTPSRVLQLERRAHQRVALGIWAAFRRFGGMPLEILTYLQWADITDPSQLPGRLSDLVFKARFGSLQFDQLEAWLARSGYPSLVPYLTPSQAQHLGR